MGMSFYDIVAEIPDEKSAEKYFAALRWPNGVHCPKCGSPEVIRGKQKKRKRQLWYCRPCKHMFSVTSGTVMESTKIPLRKWILGYHIMGGSKKGVSCRQLARMLHVTPKTAWHLCHRIRETMGMDIEPFTGIVETDESYFGGKRKGHGRGYRGNKTAVQVVLKRNTFDEHDSVARTIALNNGEKVDGRTVGAKLRTHTEPERTILMTDDSPIYDRVGQGFKEHHTVNHSAEEYVRREPDGTLATTNSAEGLFANLKRQITGTHHHVGKKHLQKYLNEFDYKFNTREQSDTERTEAAIGNIEGKRLTLYKATDGHGESLIDRKEDEPAAPRPRPEPRRKSKTKPEGEDK
jgi:transposase-like protein